MSVLVRVWSVERLEFVKQRIDDVDEEHEVHLRVKEQTLLHCQTSNTQT